MTSKEAIISKLDLKPLPGEGGFYRETYRGIADLPACDMLLKEVSGRRNLGTAIYYF